MGCGPSGDETANRSNFKNSTTVHKNYDDFIPDDTIDIGGTGIFFYNSKLLKQADFSTQSTGQILQYDCDGDQGGEYTAALYLRNEDHQRIDVLRQMCNAIEHKLPHLVKRLNDLSQVIEKTGLPFQNPGLDIEKN